MTLKPPSNMSPAEFIACARHWYECSGCHLCQSLRDKLKKEDETAVAIVNDFVATYAKLAPACPEGEGEGQKIGQKIGQTGGEQ